MPRKPIGLLLALALMSAPVAAFAHPIHPAHPAPSPAKPHKCSPHAVAYRVAGSLVSATLTPTAKNRADGTVTIAVTGANRPARQAGAVAGSTQAYTLSDARVSYAHRLTQPNPAAGTRTLVKGTITVVAPKCPDKTGAGQVTIKRVSFTPSHHAKP
jgi:hypothetical protein